MMISKIAKQKYGLKSHLHHAFSDAVSAFLVHQSKLNSLSLNTYICNNDDSITGNFDCTKQIQKTEMKNTITCRQFAYYSCID